MTELIRFFWNKHRWLTPLVILLCLWGKLFGGVITKRQRVDNATSKVMLSGRAVLVSSGTNRTMLHIENETGHTITISTSAKGGGAEERILEDGEAFTTYDPYDWYASHSSDTNKAVKVTNGWKRIR